MDNQGTGATSLRLKDLVQYDVKRVVITSAQLLALNAAAVTLVDAQGTDTAIEFISAIIHKPAGTAYADIHTDDDLEIRYTDASGAQVNTLTEATGFLDQTTEQTRIARPIVSEITPVVNAPLVLHMKTGEVTTGTSPLVITIHFRTFKNLKTVAVA